MPQLVSATRLALDSRNVEAMASLFIDDVQVGMAVPDAEALAAWYDEILRPYGITFHFIGNHVIEFEDEDPATGVVYCRPEHEVGDLWVVMPMQYWDRYTRRDGHWYFKSRKAHAFYAADVLERPLQAKDRFHFPDNPMLHEATLPEKWPTWRDFWATGRRVEARSTGRR